MCKFAHTTSEKVLVDLRTSIRGAEFNQTQLTQTFNQTQIFRIIDLCPLVDKSEKQYDKHFPSE